VENLESVGVLSMGVWLPSECEDARSIAQSSGIPENVISSKMGIKRKCRAVLKDKIDPSMMAIKAATRALEGIDPLSIDLIIWTGSEYKDFNVWSAGIYVQRELGLKNAFAFDLSARCSSNVVALGVAKSLLQTNQNYKRALLVGGHRTGDLVNYQDKSSRFLYNLADGGSAIVIEKSETNPILNSSVITDGDFSLDVIIPMGGTRKPFKENHKESDYHLTCPDIEGMRERLASRSIENFLKVIKSAASTSMPSRPIDYLSLLHMKKSAHDSILENLELTLEQSIYLENYGHFGAPDQVVSLGLAERDSVLKKGDHIVLASAGIGYTWSAISLRYDKEIFNNNAIKDLKY
jgi:3-oxoacyl-[acyl-carrier-protein] synthase-3